MEKNNFISDESGFAAIIVAFSMTLIIAMAALTIDIGQAYLASSDMQNTADAVAFSVGSMLPVSRNDTAKLNEIKIKSKEYAIKNGFNDLEDEDIEFYDINNERYYSMAVKVKKNVETNLAKVIGINYITVEKKAKITLVPTGSITGAVPIGVSKQVFDEAKTTGNYENIILKFGGGSGTEGFYGFLVLDGAKGNANILEQWLKYGYPGVNSVGDHIPTASGNKTSAAREGANYRYSLCTHYVSQGGCTKDKYAPACPRIMLTCIYNTLPDGNVEIVGFAPFIIESSSDSDEIRGSYLDDYIIKSVDKIGSKDCGSYTVKLVE